MNKDAKETIHRLIAYNLPSAIHPAYLSQILPKPLQNFSNFQCPRLKSKIARYLSHKLKLEPISPKLLQHPYCCFASTPMERWEQLSYWLGALYFLEEIKKTVHHFDQQILQSLLSKPCYDFIIHRGNLYAPIIQLIPVPKCEGELEQRIRTVGKFLLEYLWSHQPKPWLQRFLLKIPPYKTLNFQHNIQEHLQHQLFNICKHLQKEMEGMKPC
ncbi:MAG: SctK family type III secretion system sorting platform protein [Opitutales bacterium]|nr:SctK family type III secretion system sorting platform protein [Opitutales bacterium]